MRKLLVICGPTATGKTTLALKLAKKFDGEIISADSRQVYRGMDIGTGKDLPKGSKLITKNSKFKGYYEVAGVKIWGYDLADPKQGFSVGQYLKYANTVLTDITERKKLPILVGGTGLYIKGVVDGISTAQVPKNLTVRKTLDGKSTTALFETLASLDPVKAASLNTSDKKNPRRLVRAIEVAQYKLIEKGMIKENSKLPEKDVLFIGLKSTKVFLHKRIRKRVKDRLKKGLLEEIGRLLVQGVVWDDQAMDSLGYKQWEDFISKKRTKTEVINKWVGDEVKYANRQKTWFKRDKRICWFDIRKAGWGPKVVKLVSGWYDKPDA